MSWEAFVRQWKHTLASHTIEQTSSFPSYYEGASSSENGDASLVTTCTAHRFQVGTGAAIYTSTLLPALLSARSEVILVTCFWAKSQSLEALSATLVELATRRQALGHTQQLKVRIGLSSVSMLQRLLHPSRREGYIYPPSKWSSLGLPTEGVLRNGGIDLQVKSLFFNPLSVLHPKFVIIDQSIAFFPSANVSWEPWLEGCITVTGEAVSCLHRFYHEVWEYGIKSPEPTGPVPKLEWDPEAAFRAYESLGLPRTVNSSIPEDLTTTLAVSNVPTLLLISPHHRNPRFRPFPWQKPAPVPVTSLNVAILHLLSTAEKDIFLQSPNFTCHAVLDGILAALDRGVDVRIVAGGKNMMVLEQLVTAGTTTRRCLRRLVKRYRKLSLSRRSRRGSDIISTPLRSAEEGGLDVELGLANLGSLSIGFFSPWPVGRGDGHGGGDRDGDKSPSIRGGGGRRASYLVEEPTCAHLKLTVVDGAFAVLGSGNMDRASFYTSQELGILFHGEAIALGIRAAAEGALEGKVEEWHVSVG